MSTRRTALVTGAGRNIGRAVALGLAQDGFNVVVNGSADRAACEAVAEAARGFGVEALVVMADIGSAEACGALAAEAIARFGAVDVLVNNAALRPAAPFLEMEEQAWRRVIAVDLDAAVWLSRACLPGMLARGWGRIVNFTGMNAIHGYAGRAPVSVAKHGVWGLTKALAKEFGPRGITVNAISPGPIASDEERTDPAAIAYRQKAVARVPVGREGTPAEVAAVLRMLVSEGGAYVNGQMLQVNGGAET
ncbi:SDR family oxidoreductase [Roseomonas alkaliterrae]|uniref:3-oxoacyl-[acyl-carrier protein] reductase n=1 Tax=Neoroseomonas alkaliterrae TaxID=1452450 RepID=A0A840XJB4_9PROT|nr:SDR family oxidoreductase [Neoroseomonas alkaliterrae]MBB5688006.1 3-oxoacyl-[acyl-carrier protein] reductase [Neoroseomonas alkaliterrae]MBR0677062.1 SDR family oxidoreductase [Neoroseomonas alkaliterrae]